MSKQRKVSDAPRIKGRVINVRLPEALIAALDEYVEAGFLGPGAIPCRASAIRKVLAEALLAEEEK